MSKRALHTPFREGDAAKVGRNLFRKQLLPVGSIDYEGRKLDFTPDYLKGLARNFNAQAFDSVPFLLANERNEHHMDPEKYRGEVKGVEVDDAGLSVLVELSDEGAELVRKNPKLGVSARIVEGLERGGKAVGSAVQHVLGTLDPKVSGMKAWEPVELSEDDGEAIDLTGCSFSDPVKPDATKDLKPEDLTALRDLAQKVKSGEIELSSDDDAERALAALIADADKDEPAPVELSEPQRKAIELAESKAADADKRAADAIARVGKVEAELAARSFEAEKAELIRNGVPPADIDLAATLLKAGPQLIELSNGEKVDPAEVARKLLEQREGTIDFSEIGLTGDAEADEVTDLAKAWEAQDPQGAAVGSES